MLFGLTVPPLQRMGTQGNSAPGPISLSYEIEAQVLTIRMSELVSASPASSSGAFAGSNVLRDFMDRGVVLLLQDCAFFHQIT
jgi:hypothetical protein